MITKTAMTTLNNIITLLYTPTAIGKTQIQDGCLRVTCQKLKPKKVRNTFKYEKPCKSLKHNNFKRVVYTW
jgi:hypothetical protein